MEALVGYEAISSIVVMVLVLLAEGFGRFGELELPIVLAVLLFGSGLVFAHCAGALAVIIREIFADALLGLAAAIVLVSSAGVLVMRGAYDKLHFVTPAALVAPVLVTLAVLVYAGFSAATAETCWRCCSW